MHSGYIHGFLSYQCRMTPAIINALVTMYINTIIVRMQAIRSASSSELLAFSPKALAQSRQNLFELIIRMERNIGIEPMTRAWKAFVLPLN